LAARVTSQPGGGVGPPLPLPPLAGRDDVGVAADGTLWAAGADGDVRAVHPDDTVTDTRLAGVTAGRLVVAGGEPAVFDADRSVVHRFDAAGGERSAVPLDIPPDPDLRVGGTTDRNHRAVLLVSPATGVLTVAPFDGPPRPVPLADPPGQRRYGDPVERDGLVFVPNLDTGEIKVIDPGQPIGARPPIALDRHSFRLDVLGRRLWFVDADTDQAGLITDDLEVHFTPLSDEIGGDPDEPGGGDTTTTTHGATPTTSPATTTRPGATVTTRPGPQPTSPPPGGTATRPPGGSTTVRPGQTTTTGPGGGPTRTSGEGGPRPSGGRGSSTTGDGPPGRGGGTVVVPTTGGPTTGHVPSSASPTAPPPTATPPVDWATEAQVSLRPNPPVPGQPITFSDETDGRETSRSFIVKDAHGAIVQDSGPLGASDRTFAATLPAGGYVVCLIVLADRQLAPACPSFTVGVRPGVDLAIGEVQPGSGGTINAGDPVQVSFEYRVGASGQKVVADLLAGPTVFSSDEVALSPSDTVTGSTLTIRPSADLQPVTIDTVRVRIVGSTPRDVQQAYALIVNPPAEVRPAGGPGGTVSMGTAVNVPYQAWLPAAGAATVTPVTADGTQLPPAGQSFGNLLAGHTEGTLSFTVSGSGDVVVTGLLITVEGGVFSAVRPINPVTFVVVTDPGNPDDPGDCIPGKSRCIPPPCDVRVCSPCGTHIAYPLYRLPCDPNLPRSIAVPGYPQPAGRPWPPDSPSLIVVALLPRRRRRRRSSWP
jgi:hypothetical protein